MGRHGTNKQTKKWDAMHDAAWNVNDYVTKAFSVIHHRKDWITLKKPPKITGAGIYYRPYFLQAVYPQ